MSKGKIDAAYTATNSIMSEIERARALLGGPFMANGYGVLTDPGEVRRAIRASIESLSAALKLSEATRWPNRIDYDSPDEDNDNGDV